MFRCKYKRASRAFSLAELLVFIVILGMFTTLAVAIVAPALNAPNKQQAKVDTEQTAVQGLYRMQRDLRMADANGVWSCTSTTVPVCQRPTTARRKSDAVVMVSPLVAGQLQWDATNPTTNGLPIWKGVEVYWLVPNGSGSNTLYRQYEDQTTLGVSLGEGPVGAAGVSLNAVQLSVTSAVAASSASVVGTNVLELWVGTQNPPMVQLMVKAVSSDSNRTNQTSYEADTFARN
jgi:type II secretory pathway pseudopilin PulG